MAFHYSEFPKIEVWRDVLFTPRLLLTMAGFLVYDNYILGGAVPYVASYLAGQIAGKFLVEPTLELFLVVIMTFCMVLISSLCYFESGFWKQLFVLDESYYCILFARDCINCYSLYYTFSRFLSIIFYVESKAPWGFKKYYLGQAVPNVLLKSLNTVYSLPVEVHNLTMYDNMNWGLFCEKHQEECMNSAEFSISIALLASSVARLLYINSLYSFTTAVKLFSDVNPFFQAQIRPQCNDFCQQTPNLLENTKSSNWFGGWFRSNECDDQL